MELQQGVALWRLEQGKANAMSRPMLDELERRLDELEGSPATAAVITGYDRFFSAGLALPMLLGLPREAMRRFIERFNEVMLRLFTCPLPIVAAINGHAIAGGCVLALMADQRLMAAGASKIGLNEVQLGIGLPAVVIEGLRIAVPTPSLRPIALEGRLLAPAEARDLGLVDEVVAADRLLDEALARAVRLGALPSAGFRQIKAALRRPAAKAIAAVGSAENERWLDSWFSPAAQALLTETVARLHRQG